MLIEGDNFWKFMGVWFPNSLSFIEYSTQKCEHTPHERLIISKNYFSIPNDDVLSLLSNAQRFKDMVASYDEITGNWFFDSKKAASSGFEVVYSLDDEKVVPAD